MSDKNLTVENLEAGEFGNKKIVPLFWKYSLLALLGSILQTCSLIADGIFVGNGIGSIGLATIGIITVLWVVTASLAGMFGVGGGTIISTKLGEGDVEGARKAYATIVIFSFLFALLISVIALINIDSLLMALGATSDILPHAKDYAIPFFIGFPFCVTGTGAYYYVRAAGRPKSALVSYTVPSVIAILLEYYMIYKTDLGMSGSSIPWVICVGLPFLLVFHMQIGKKELHIKMSDFKIDFSIVKDVTKICMAAFLSQICTVVSTIIINHQIIVYGGSELEIASFGTINAYIAYLITLLISAFVAGMQPIASYNLGMKSWDRVRELIKKSFIYSCVFVNLLLVIVVIFSRPIVEFFSGDDLALVDSTTSILKVFIPMYGLGSMSLFVGGYFMAAGKNIKAIVSTISRIVFFAVPLLFIVPKIMGLSGIWFAQPVADVLAFILTGILIIIEYKKLGQKDISERLDA